MKKNEKNGLILAAALMIAFLTLGASTPCQASLASMTPKTDTLTSESTTVLDEEENADLEKDNAANRDPLEKLNRVIFTFNDTLDIYFIKPVAEFYNDVVPKPVNKSIHNFFNNLSELPIIANDLLQFNFYQMIRDITRFAINTTIGVGGFFDMATLMDLPYSENDFGLTLAHWGYQDSTYLVLPFLGPSTIRDGIGIPVDYFGFSIYPHVQPQSTQYQLLALYFIDHRANLLRVEPILEEVAIDKYVFTRHAYMQHRAYQIEKIKQLGYKEQKKNNTVSE